MERENLFEKEFLIEVKEYYEYYYYDEECGCYNYEYYYYDENCGCYDYEYYYSYDEECDCYSYEYYKYDENCGCYDYEYYYYYEGCGCSDYNYDYYYVDEIFISWGVEIFKKYFEFEINDILRILLEFLECGIILCVKGII